jgi:phosphoglycolate phosphatase
MKKLVILDLDGTLLNTISDLGTATNYALTQMGYNTHPIDSYNTMVGNGVRKLLERALPLEERSPNNIARMLEHFMVYYDAHLWDNTTIYPGVRELLNELASRNINIAVASNKYQSAVDRLVQHFFGDLKWAAVYGQREGVPVKPDPSVVFEVLTDCPTSKDDVLYVGDSGVDMATAQRACVESCGVTWGFRSRQELEEGYADHIVDNADDILSLV